MSNVNIYSHSNSEIKVSLDKNGSQRIITFKDYGIGIKEEERKNLFEEYGITSAQLTSREVSTGLCLSLAKRILDELGGSISLKSEFGVGSIFEVRI